jgi:hypothetical protein
MGGPPGGAWRGNFKSIYGATQFRSSPFPPGSCFCFYELLSFWEEMENFYKFFSNDENVLAHRKPEANKSCARKST